MCAETQNQLEKLAKQVGNTEGIKRARIILKNQDKGTDIIKQELNQVQEEITVLKTLADERKADISKLRIELSENTKKTNFITDTVLRLQDSFSGFQKKVLESELFQGAAVASVVLKLCSTKSGKFFLLFMSCCMGLALAYVIKEIPDFIHIVSAI